jgi:cyclophilin family peptidyl-prolyl cis-trans isomerase
MVNRLKFWRRVVQGLTLFTLATGLAEATDSTYVRFNTTIGNIDVQMLSDEAPMNVANFMSYMSSYSNVIINRSVPGFIFQAGEYTLVSNSSGNSIGSNTPGNPVMGEHSLANAHSNTRGTIAFALTSGGPDTGTNQWFFNEVDNNSNTADANLDSEGFTVFGVVTNTSSLAVMDAIAAVPVYLPPNPFISQMEYDADTNPTGPSPDDFAFGRVPLANYNAANGLFISNLVIVNSVTTLTTTDFTAWQTAAFQNDANKATDSLPAAMPQNDSTPNLLKYAFDITANASMTAADRAKLPTVGTTTVSGTMYMTLTYHQRPNLVGVFVNVETSTDLATWAAPTNATMTQTTATDGSGDSIMVVQVPAPTSGFQFMRLNVTQ